MNITKKKDHYLFKDLHSGAEYHLSHSEYDRLGKEKAIEFVKNELKKKAESSNYTDLDIDFKRARKLGFCEYGVDDFCNRLNLNPTNTYKLSFLLKKLDVDTFLEYPSELVKLFGKSVFDKFGGVKKFLNDNKSQSKLNTVLISGILPDRSLHLLATKFAMSILPIFEKEYPDDDRPRKVIEAKLAYLDGKIDEWSLTTMARELVISAIPKIEMWSIAPVGAVKSAVYSASWAASKSATKAASESAAYAIYPSWSISDKSPYLAELSKQIDMVIEELNK